ncbi:MAG TPA: HAD family hydrolase [Planctomycetota bacterium]|nr:HAD family hydrolase [Planctomycetota bacterium]
MKAVFLDRDGTLIVERGYITVPEGVELIPGAAAAVTQLRKAGWKVFVVTNQGSVAKGMITEEELGLIHFRMISLLAEQGAELDGIYYCPHHPDGDQIQYSVECDCRKPRPGMLERAASEHGLDLDACVMIGDTVRDIEAGHSTGGKAVLVLTGHGPDSVQEEHGADHVADDLAAAALWLLAL